MINEIETLIEDYERLIFGGIRTGCLKRRLNELLEEVMGMKLYVPRKRSARKRVRELARSLAECQHDNRFLSESLALVDPAVVNQMRNHINAVDREFQNMRDVLQAVARNTIIMLPEPPVVEPKRLPSLFEYLFGEDQ